MGKALSGELSCPCDRSCFLFCSFDVLINQSIYYEHKDGKLVSLAVFEENDEVLS